MINYNGNSNPDFDNNIEFVDIDLSCNKLSIQLLTNNLITCIKKNYIFEIEDKTNKLLKVKAT